MSEAKPSGRPVPSPAGRRSPSSPHGFAARGERRDAFAEILAAVATADQIVGGRQRRACWPAPRARPFKRASRRVPYNAKMRFEWDVRKAAANLRNHRVSFEEASTALRDGPGLDWPRSRPLEWRATIHHIWSVIPGPAASGLPYRSRRCNPDHQRTHSNEIRTEDL